MLKPSLQIATRTRMDVEHGTTLVPHGTRVVVDAVALRWYGPTTPYIAVHVTEPKVLRGWVHSWYFELWAGQSKAERRPESEDAPVQG